MAEVIGIVSGSLAFAEATAGSVRGIIRLRQLWNDVKDVPRAIEELMTQIEGLDHILWSLERNCNDETLFLSSADDEMLKKSTHYCRQTLNQFTRLVDDLTFDVNAARGFSRRTKAKLMVVLSKSTLAQYEQRMRDAILNLGIAQSFCTQELVKTNIKLAHETKMLLTQGYTNAHVSTASAGAARDEKSILWKAGPDSMSKSRSLSIWKPRPFPKAGPFGRFSYETLDDESEVDDAYQSAPHSRYAIHVQLPSWLFCKAWEYQVSKSAAGWQTNLQAAAMGCSIEVVKALVTMGVDAFALNDTGYSALHMIVYRFPRRSAQDHDAFINQFLGVVDMWDINHFSTQIQLCWFVERLCRDGFNDIVTMGMKFGHTIDDGQNPGERLSSIYRVMSHFHANHMRLALRLGPENERIKAVDVRSSIERGVSFLHGVSLWYGMTSMATDADVRGPEARKLVSETIQASDDIHLLRDGILCSITNDDGDSLFNYRVGSGWNVKETPFVLFLRGSYFFSSSHAPHGQVLSQKWKYDRQVSGMRTQARDWARILDESGFDLCRHGLRENLLLQESGQLGNRWKAHVEWFKFGEGVGWTEPTTLAEPKLLELRYGPRPEDWDLIWDMDVEELAGDFWEMIDEMPLPIPGAWVDD
ncbi:predicted protein [Verticillium alfalfae VaMs.102]|uniref:Predicted protein n=1 Tax=Verticillium alfalfae (strain VaMs.102 / ATCC MYA-4576 / FGSC 10136) TaxID=526221 RepID=C9SU27_VERA1|nr:predicted protein [Verticillium alfalfae VaMs.102]EEY22338.1 predicted protein [Verticillium alfalfae VaMs.102]